MADAADVAEASSEEPAREDTGGLLREDREHGPEKEADERDRNAVLDERGHEPDRHFESKRGGVRKRREEGESNAYEIERIA